MSDLVRVRVLFLEPGNFACQSQLDTGLHSVSVEEGKELDYGDLELCGYCELDKDALGDALKANVQIALYSPNDPQVLILKPLIIVEIDPLGMSADWAEEGAVAYERAMVGAWDLFKPDLKDFIEYATFLKDKRPKKRNVHRDEWGIKVFFHAQYQFKSWQCQHTGEWDSATECLGVVDIGMLEPVGFDMAMAQVPAPQPDDNIFVL